MEAYTIRDAYFWKITLALALASFFVFAALYAIQPILPVFVTSFDVSVAEASISFSSTIIGLIAGLIVLGILSDRYGRTFFIKLSLLGSVIPFFIIPVLDSFLLLIFLRFVQGFMLAGLSASALAYLSEEIDRKSLGVATSFFISGNALGGMGGRVFAGYIAGTFSWEAAFVMLGVSGIFIHVAVHILLPKSRFFKTADLSFKKDLKGFLFHLKDPVLLLVFGIGIVLQMSFTGVWTYLPFYLQNEPFSLPIETISYTFLAYSLGVVGSPAAGWFADRFGLEKVRVAGIALMSLGIFMTLHASLAVIVIGLCIMCLGFFTGHSLTATFVSKYAAHHKGSATSLYLVAYYVGVTLGGSALAPLWENGGWYGMILVTGTIPLIYFAIVKIIQYYVQTKDKGD
jgi:YNFM family putative membrane transporter